MKITRFAAALCFAVLLAPNLARASSCYVREYQTIATIGTTRVEVAPEAGTSIDQTPITLSGSAASSAAFNKNTNLVRIICGASASFVFGATPSATTSNSPIAALSPEYFAVAPGQFVSFIANATP